MIFRVVLLNRKKGKINLFIFESALGTRDSFVTHTHQTSMTHQRKTQNEENKTQRKNTSRKKNRWTIEDNKEDDIKDKTILYSVITRSSQCSIHWPKRTVIQ